mgnify:FL=1
MPSWRLGNLLVLQIVAFDPRAYIQINKKTSSNVPKWSRYKQVKISLARGNVKGAVAVINRATVAVGIEFNDTARVLTNSDTNESSIGLSLGATEAVSITVLDLAGVRVSSKVRLALELAWGCPAVALDCELAAVTGVVTGRVVIGIGLVVNSFAGLVYNRKAFEVAVGVAAGRTGNRREVAA